MFWLLLVVAGNETTRNALSGAVARPARARPVGVARRAPRAPADRGRGAAALRVAGHAVPPDRDRRTTILGDQEIRAGDKVVVWFGAANRDPAVFDDPHGLDLVRDPNPHLAFGVGPHFCLGAHLARLEMTAMLGELLAARPDLRSRPAWLAPPRRSSTASAACRSRCDSAPPPARRMASAVGAGAGVAIVLLLTVSTGPAAWAATRYSGTAEARLVNVEVYTQPAVAFLPPRRRGRVGRPGPDRHPRQQPRLCIDPVPRRLGHPAAVPRRRHRQRRHQRRPPVPAHRGVDPRRAVVPQDAGHDRAGCRERSDRRPRLGHRRHHLGDRQIHLRRGPRPGHLPGRVEPLLRRPHRAPDPRRRSHVGHRHRRPRRQGRAHELVRHRQRGPPRPAPRGGKPRPHDPRHVGPARRRPRHRAGPGAQRASAVRASRSRSSPLTTPPTG